jgi:hypothetical protein
MDSLKMSLFHDANTDLFIDYSLLSFASVLRTEKNASEPADECYSTSLDYRKLSVDNL